MTYHICPQVINFTFLWSPRFLLLIWYLNYPPSMTTCIVLITHHAEVSNIQATATLADNAESSCCLSLMTPNVATTVIEHYIRFLRWIFLLIVLNCHEAFGAITKVIHQLCPEFSFDVCLSNVIDSSLVRRLLNFSPNWQIFSETCPGGWW